MKKVAAIILAGGNATRFKSNTLKQFVKLDGKPIVEHTIDIFEDHPLIDDIYVVIHKEYYSAMNDIAKQRQYKKIKKILIGGKFRQDSSRIGVYAIEDDIDKILIHAAARPFVSKDIISNIILALDKFSAVTIAIPTPDIIMEVDKDNNIVKNILSRENLLRIQTPQGFLLSLMKKAHMLAENDKYNNSADDCTLILKYNLCDIHILNGSEYNMKVTYPLDIDIAEKMCQLFRKKKD